MDWINKIYVWFNYRWIVRIHQKIISDLMSDTTKPIIISTTPQRVTETRAESRNREKKQIRNKSQQKKREKERKAFFSCVNWQHNTLMNVCMISSNFSVKTETRNISDIKATTTKKTKTTTLIWTLAFWFGLVWYNDNIAGGIFTYENQKLLKFA